MPVDNDDMILTQTEYFVTESKLNPKATPEEISAFTKKLGTTGVVTHTVSQGGVKGIVVTERTHLSDDQANTIREMLDMETDDEDEDELPAPKK